MERELPEPAADGMGLKGRGAGGLILEGLSVVAKLGLSIQAARPELRKTRPLPRPAPRLALAAELKITVPFAPRRPRPQPLPRPLPHWAWGQSHSSQFPKRKKKKEKAARGGGGGGGGAGRGRGARPYGCDFSARRQTGSSAALGARPPPARPPAASLLPSLSLSPLRSLASPPRMGPAPGPGASGRRASGVP